MCWYSADNRRCFTFMVIAPLCNLSSVRVQVVNWTSEFDSKLMQCPQRGETWATDSATIEVVRSEVIALLCDEIPPQPKRRRESEKERQCMSFESDKDYVSKLNIHVNATRRPKQGEICIHYELVGALPSAYTFHVRINGDALWHKGMAQQPKKMAKQAAAYVALRTICPRAL
eukprot:TRINITY_DN15683_c0_g1_i1.p1 TRINITY_DN15683_c0_g1~~TRINITY_DN15683_c0_g1_i1.p1  ORF type:complete len:200 (+),score=22.90 TRINITY_DN15683_c0_g1_i1:82-600(+)